MAKVSIGLRGWRFDESDVFDADGNFRALDEMSDDARNRLTRLTGLHGNPCHACWLVHEEKEPCNPAAAVYGEPHGEVLLCEDHEPDFLYWYGEMGHEHRGEEAFADRFHEWFDAGNRAPERYREDVTFETGNADLPMPERPDLEFRNADVPEGSQVEIDLRNGEAYEGEEVTERHEERKKRKAEAEELDTDDLDLDSEYPT